MSRTRRRKPQGDPGIDRDGGSHVKMPLPSSDFVVEVRRPDRRTREDEADKIARGDLDPDDTPVAPKPRRKWQFWRRW